MTEQHHLVDPRIYGSGVDSPWQGLDERALVSRLRELASTGADAEIQRILSGAASQPEYTRLWRALCEAIEKPSADDAVAPRVFAIPWVIVAGGSAPARVGCVLPEVGALARVLQEHGVFGGSRSLGLSNALCAMEALELLKPSEALHGWGNPCVRDMAPAPIAVLRGVEDVHVRFLLGAAIAPAHAPSINETGSNIGAWGTAALKAMAAQLATPNVQLLPMPRPPAGLYSAAYSGRRAGIEAAFNLFMSNSVRRFRASTGDPSVTLSSHTGGVVRIVLWTPFDDAMVEGFSWPLHPADDLDEIERTILSLIAECNLREPTLYPTLLPDRTSTGALLFRTARDSVG
ncbi:MAG: hypothetical protein V4637_16455 [Pseudomonadota bacterium]